MKEKISWERAQEAVGLTTLTGEADSVGFGRILCDVSDWFVEEVLKDYFGMVPVFPQMNGSNGEKFSVMLNWTDIENLTILGMLKLHRDSIVAVFNPVSSEFGYRSLYVCDPMDDMSIRKDVGYFRVFTLNDQNNTSRNTHYMSGRIY